MSRIDYNHSSFYFSSCLSVNSCGGVMEGKEKIYDDLLKCLKENEYPQEDIAFIQKAYFLADKQHTGQKRASGEEYIIHPLSVALYLAKMKVDREMIATGLLHDVVEDTDYTLEQIASEFGESVANLVNGVTKITTLKNSPSKSDLKAETIRKMLLAMIEDIRVIIIKLSDKVHNMSTLCYVPEEKQKRTAKECLEIYAPLAGKLGLGVIKSQLEDLSLQALKPNIYEEIINFSKEREKEKKGQIAEVTKKLQQKLEKVNFKYTIKSRTKHPYSVYNKMRKFNKKLEDVFDLYGVRIITETVEDCYAIFGMVHSLFQPVPGRFKDYIANPKSNGYKSLHTTVMVAKRTALEIQIRTYEMDQKNEYGVAAHWYYKTGEKNGDLKWLEQLKNMQAESLSPAEYYQTIRDDILREEIYVFSPKGDIFKMPQGATALDFAYKVHTQVGHRCRGAKVAGKIVPLGKALKNGAIVDIITGKDACPKMEWLSLVKTTEAKKKIRAFFAGQEKTQESQPVPISNNDKASEIIDSEFTPERLGQTMSVTDNRRVSIEVDGEKNLLFSFARCCHPVPTDRILGFVSRGRGIIIHREDCESLRRQPDYNERVLHADWGGIFGNKTYSFFLKVAPTNKHYIELMGYVKKKKGSVLDYRLDESTKNGREIDCYLSVNMPASIDEHRILKDLRNLPSVYFVGKR